MLPQLSRHLKLSLLFAFAATFLGRCSAETLAQHSVVAVIDSIPAPEAVREAEMLKLTPPPPPECPREEILFGTREIMPLFPGSDAGKPYWERKAKADSLLLSFLYGNLRYPHTARRDSVQGMAVVSFFIEKDGSVTGAKVVRNPGAGTGEEALRIVNLMAELNLRWVPGSQMGKPVRVQFNLPVKFKLSETTRAYPPPPLPQDHQQETARHPPTMPQFPGCAEVGNFYAQRECSDSLLRAFIYGNLRYPYRAHRDNVEGIAAVSFMIEEDGRVSSVKLLRSPGKGTGKEALRLVELMARKDIRWVPGTRDGEPVRVQFNLPIRFNITGKTRVAFPPPPPQPPPPPPPPPKVEEIFSVVERMPLFPGCDGVVDYEEKKACAFKKLMEFVYGNIKYPPEAIARGVEGSAVITFIVEKDGKISGAKVMHDPGAGTGTEALRVINLINTKGLRFDPPSSSARAVRALYNLPVKFELKADESNKKGESSISPCPPPPPPSAPGKGPILLFAEQMPLFPGCDTSLEYEGRKTCAIKKMLTFISKNLKWPVSARDNCFEGMAVVSFIVEKDGSISEPKVVRNPGAGSGEEALRVVKLMNERGLLWEPGRQDGKAVRVRFNLPVKFKLE